MLERAATNLQPILHALHDRRRFRADVEGYVVAGIGPPDLQDGDYVFKPPNMIPDNAAFVVRPTSMSRGVSGPRLRFRLVGLCFLMEEPVESGEGRTAVPGNQEILLI